MMDYLKNNKLSVLGAAALVVAVWAYFTFFNTTSAPLTATQSDAEISGDLLATLNSLHTVRLDNSIFSDAIYLSLTDYGVALPPQAAGRRNPFAPTGGVSSGNSTTTR